jgi:enoyl-CoA hydratase
VTVHREQRDGVTLVTLDRPDRRNALDPAACAELAAAVDEAVAAGTRALVLTGAGPHFCAGADLGGVEDASFAEALRVALSALAHAPVPTVAAVQGAALGAGTQLAIACDLRVAEATARFGIPAARLGLMVDHWTMQRLALAAGYSPARAMLIAAQEYDGEAAHRIGMVQRLTPPGAAVATALEWASELATFAPLTMAGHKLGLNALEQAVGADPVVSAAFARAWSSEDLVEGMTARAEKRPPQFRGH